MGNLSDKLWNMYPLHFFYYRFQGNYSMPENAQYSVIPIFFLTLISAFGTIISVKTENVDNKYLKPMKNLSLKNWMLTSLNGFLAIIFGLVALLFPSITLAALAIFFAISILIGGLMLTIGSFRIKNSKTGWYFLLVEGIIGIILGLLILARPGLAAAVFVAIIGIWAIFLGLIFLIAYFRKHLPEFERGFLLLIGILSLLFGVLITVNPFESSRVIIVLIGVYTIAYGVFSIIHTSKKYY